MLRAFEESSKTEIHLISYSVFYAYIEKINKLQSFKSKPQRGSERNRENTHTLSCRHIEHLYFFFSPKLNLSTWDFSLPQTWLPRFNTNTALNRFLFSSNHLKGHLCKLIWYVLRCLLLLPIHFVLLFFFNLFFFFSFDYYYIYICL